MVCDLGSVRARPRCAATAGVGMCDIEAGRVMALDGRCGPRGSGGVACHCGATPRVCDGGAVPPPALYTGLLVGRLRARLPAIVAMKNHC